MPDIIDPIDVNDPAFQVRRSPGDYVRAGVDGEETALRWDMEVPEEIFQALFLSQPVGYDSIQLWWGVPPPGLLNWSHMGIVRSGFGHPSTPSDGEIVYYLKRPDVYNDATIKDIPGTIFDGPWSGDLTRPPLTPGRWYYYTLFFRIGGRWIISATTESLVPKDYRHREHLLGLVPPFYLETEANDSRDFIRRWMTMIGYDLDYTRTLTEGVQQIYDPDSAPQALLDALGQQNLGFNKPSALGDIRYRSVIAKNRDILFNRGTTSGLKTYVESVFKSVVTVNNGLNELLTVDDAEFYSGVGNWSPMPWRIGYEVAHSPYGANVVSPPAAALPIGSVKTRGVKIEPFVQRDDSRPDCPPVLGAPLAPVPFLPLELAAARGIARIQTSNSSEHLAITCGAGQQDVIVGVDSANHRMELHEQHLDAYYRGVPVEPGITYYLSFWSARVPGNNESDLVAYGFAQYSRDPATQGFSDGFRTATAPTPLATLGGFDGWQGRDARGGAPVTTATILGFRRPVHSGASADDWEHHVASFTTETWCRYVVPFIWFQGPVSGGAGSMPATIQTPRYITGVMVNKSQTGGAEAGFRADEFLKLLAQSTVTKHVIGAPAQPDTPTGFDRVDRTQDAPPGPPYKSIGGD